MAELLLDVSLALGAGRHRWRIETDADAVAIVGPSGSGKSTLLRVLAGLERRAEGRVGFRGVMWQEGREILPPWRRRVGWVPQDAVLFPHRSVRANLGWAGPAPEALERVAHLLGVDGLLDRRPRRLSGGERQRVALGRALLSGAQLLLLDEPFAALDRRLRADVAGVVAQLRQEQGASLVLVSHDEADVAALAGEVWELSGGELTRLR